MGKLTLRNKRVVEDPRKARWTTRRSGTQEGLDVDVTGVPIHGINSKGEPICASQRPGMPRGVICHRRHRMGNGRCPKHGGKTPTGIFSPNFIDGTASKYTNSLAPEFAGAFKAFKELTDALSMRDDLALYDVLMEQEVAHRDTSLDDFTLAELQGYYEEVESELHGDDPFEEVLALRTFVERVGVIIETGIDYNRKNATIERMQKHRLQVAEYERKKLEGDRGTMNRVEVMMLITNICGAVASAIRDSRIFSKGPGAVLAAIGMEVDRLLHGLRSPLAIAQHQDEPPTYVDRDDHEAESGPQETFGQAFLRRRQLESPGDETITINQEQT